MRPINSLKHVIKLDYILFHFNVKCITFHRKMYLYKNINLFTLPVRVTKTVLYCNLLHTS